MTPHVPTILAMHAAVGLFAVTAVARPDPLLIWNATASVPVGLYAVRALRAPAVGDLVAVRPPEPLAERLAEDGYLPCGASLLKHVAALRSQTVCRMDLTITIDGVAAAVARERDHAGRRLPVWQGCRTLGERDVFLLNRDAPASLDGRYFGSLPASTIIGRAVPLWTW